MPYDRNTCKSRAFGWPKKKTIEITQLYQSEVKAKPIALSEVQKETES